ncbi:hypothetical protein Tco_0569774 [Tanacetum coccineum]
MTTAGRTIHMCGNDHRYRHIKRLVLECRNSVTQRQICKLTLLVQFLFHPMLLVNEELFLDLMLKIQKDGKFANAKGYKRSKAETTGH